MSKVLISSKNDENHDFEYLGSRIVEWSKGLENVKVQVGHDKRMLVNSELDTFDLCILCITPGEFTNEEEQSVINLIDKGKNLFGIHKFFSTD